jgi:hypothetical protein
MLKLFRSVIGGRKNIIWQMTIGRLSKRTSLIWADSPARQGLRRIAESGRRLGHGSAGGTRAQYGTGTSYEDRRRNIAMRILFIFDTPPEENWIMDHGSRISHGFIFGGVIPFSRGPLYGP